MKGTGAPLFPGKKPEDLDIRDSMVFEKMNPDNRKTVAEVANEFWNADPAIAHPLTGPLTGLESDGKPDQRIYFMARQSHFIEVAVDTETGHVEITDMVCVNDVGHVFNPQGPWASSTEELSWAWAGAPPKKRSSAPEPAWD
jgi:CO/xanthine dehydrogenase Mo-binding subunit